MPTVRKGNGQSGMLKRTSLAAVVILVAVMIGLLLRHALFARSPVGIGLQVSAVLLMLWARRTLGVRSFHAAADPMQGDLVTTGPYRYLRHPIYAAILWFLLIGVASHPSLPNVGLGLLAGAAVAVRIAAEERFLAERYPQYAEYAARTKRVLPFVV